MTFMTNRSINYMPSRFRTRLTFQKLASINNNTFTFANIRFVPTNCYDIDPQFATTAMPGFSELGSLYRLYRAKSFRISVSFSNLDATSVNCYICPINIDPGVNDSTAQNLLSNRRMRNVMIGPSTGMSTSKSIGTRVAIDEFGGVKWSGQIDQYCSSTSGSAPTNNIYLAVGIETSPAMTLGVVAVVKITVDLEFFELSSPSA